MLGLQRTLVVAGIALGLSVLSGCGEAEEQLYDVAGTVTHNGQPVPKGLIFFDPDATKGTEGGQGFANIVDGRFNTAEEGRGVRGGAYEVRINGFDGKQANEAPFGQPLFMEYRTTKEFPKEHSAYDLDVPATP